MSVFGDGVFAGIVCWCEVLGVPLIQGDWGSHWKRSGYKHTHREEQCPRALEGSHQPEGKPAFSPVGLGLSALRAVRMSVDQTSLACRVLL